MRNLSPLQPLVIEGPPSDIIAAMRKRVAQSNIAFKKGGYIPISIEIAKEIETTLSTFVPQNESVSPTAQKHLLSRFLELASRSNVRYDRNKNADILHQLVDELAQNVTALQDPTSDRKGTRPGSASADIGKMVTATVAHGAVAAKLKEEFPGSTNHHCAQAFFSASPRETLRQKIASLTITEAEKPVELPAPDIALTIDSRWAQLLPGGESALRENHSGNVTANRLRGSDKKR